MTSVKLLRMAGRYVHEATLEFAPGLHVITSSDEAALEELYGLMTGVSSPRRGKVLIRGEDPSRNPSCRAHVGTVWPLEFLPAGRSSRTFLCELGFGPARAQAVEDRLATLGGPTVGSQGERARLFHLGVALTTPDPWLFMLHEPFTLLPAQAQVNLHAELLELSAEGPVIVTTASPSVATRLGGSAWTLQGGFFRRVVEQPAAWYRIEVWGIGLDTVIGELSRGRAMRNLRLQLESNGQELLTLVTRDPDRVRLDLARLGVSTGAHVLSIHTSAEPA